MARPKFEPEKEYPVKVTKTMPASEAEHLLACRLCIPRGWVRMLASLERVKLDGQVFKLDGEAVKRGSELSVTFPQTWPPYMQPQEMPLAIIHEDEDIIALDKPAGIVVHPARGHMDCNTLQNGVLHHCRDIAGKEGITIGPAHRLDKDTTGIIIFGKTTSAYRELVETFTRRQAHKEYLAIVDGRPDFDRRRATEPLGIDPQNNKRGSVLAIEDGGKEAVTELEVLRKGKDWALVRARPQTGRPHQVRLHLAASGHPVMNDLDYNPKVQEGQRQALHASKLELLHPTSKESLLLQAPLPQDMTEFLNSAP